MTTNQQETVILLKVQAETLELLTRAGFTPESSRDAVVGSDLALLKPIQPTKVRG